MTRDSVSPRLYQAMEYVFRIHGTDARKQSEVPVMAHLFSVCALVQYDGGDEDEAIAALLHDSLEDKPQETSRQEIRTLFGDRVLALIDAATDTPADYAGGAKPPWRQRKEEYLRHVRQTDPSRLRVTVADKVDNDRAILADYRRLGEGLWQRFNAGKADQLWYYRSAAEAYHLAGVRSALLDELVRLVQELEVAVNSAT